MAAARSRKPVKKGVAKVPVVMQLEALECGAASLAMVMAYYGKWVPLEHESRDIESGGNFPLHHSLEHESLRCSQRL